VLDVMFAAPRKSRATTSAVGPTQLNKPLISSFRSQNDQPRSDSLPRVSASSLSRMSSIEKPTLSNHTAQKRAVSPSTSAEIFPKEQGVGPAAVDVMRLAANPYVRASSTDHAITEFVAAHYDPEIFSGNVIRSSSRRSKSLDSEALPIPALPSNKRVFLAQADAQKRPHDSVSRSRSRESSQEASGPMGHNPVKVGGEHYPEFSEDEEAKTNARQSRRFREKNFFCSPNAKLEPVSGGVRISNQSEAQERETGGETSIIESLFLQLMERFYEGQDAKYRRFSSVGNHEDNRNADREWASPPVEEPVRKGSDQSSSLLKDSASLSLVPADDIISGRHSQVEIFGSSPSAQGGSGSTAALSLVTFTCGVCGAKRSSGNFCGRCGGVLPSAEQCRQCKSLFRGNFCNFCGVPKKNPK
jgi:hypothetical protein